MSSMQPPSFASFYEEVRDRVFQTVLVTGRHPTRAEDAVGDAFAKAYEKWESVGRMANPTGWVIRVAINRYNSDWRIWRRELADPPDAGPSRQTIPRTRIWSRSSGGFQNASARWLPCESLPTSARPRQGKRSGSRRRPSAFICTALSLPCAAG